MSAPVWFVRRLADLHAQYGGRHMPDHMPDAWWQALGTLPRAAVEVALDRAPAETSPPQWMPTAELVRRIAATEAKATPRGGAPLALPEPPPERPLRDGSPFAALAAEWEASATGRTVGADEGAERARAIFELLSAGGTFALREL